MDAQVSLRILEVLNNGIEFLYFLLIMMAACTAISSMVAMINTQKLVKALEDHKRIASSPSRVIPLLPKPIFGATK